MSALDLDQLKARWAEQTRRIDDSLVLDVEAVRATLQRRISRAFAWHRRRRMVGLAIGGSCVSALLAFIAVHWGQWDWVKIAALLLPLLLAEIVIDLREWLAVRRLELDAPVIRVRDALNRLRWRRLRLAKGYLLFSLVLWWPFVLVLFKGLLGVDLLRWLPPIVLLANLVVGVAFIPAALLAAWCLNRWFGHTPGWQRFLDESAGLTWRRASDAFAEQEAFETAVRDGSLTDAAGFAPLSDDVRADLDGLRRHLLVGIFGCAGLILMFALFNVSQGGQVRFIVPGTLLLWCAVAHMGVQILNRQALSRLDGGTAGLRDRLLAMMAVRRRFALLTVVLSPFFALLLAMVVGKVLGVDLTQSLSAVAQTGMALVTLVASALLWQRIRRDPDAFAPRLVDAICFRFMSRARRLSGKLHPELKGIPHITNGPRE